MSKEIMQMALNVLHNISNSMRIAQVSGNDWRRELKLSENASNHLIAALEAALAKPEKEPMSFQTWRSRQHGDPEEIGFLQALKHAYESGQYSVSPPRKEWVGLTDEERVQAFVDAGLELAYMDYDADMKISNAIEAKLKEKNHG